MTDRQERQVADHEFLDVADDPVRARLLRKSLEVLSKNAKHDALQEMAKEVLSGRVGLREAVGTSAYADAMIETMEPFKHRWDAMSDAERQRLADEGSDLAQQEREEMLREQRGSNDRSRLGNSSSSARHNTKGWSLY